MNTTSRPSALLDGRLQIQMPDNFCFLQFFLVLSAFLLDRIKNCAWACRVQYDMCWLFAASSAAGRMRKGLLPNHVA